MQSEITLEDSSFPAWKNLLLVAVFLTITPITLVTSIFSLYSLSTVGEEKREEVSHPVNILGTSASGVRVYASLPSTLPSISSTIGTADARAEIIRQYLLSYDSPLAPYADSIITASDKYGLDYRLITAIAQQESNLCKKIPPGSFNCWGWGIHSQGTLGFSSYDSGIEEVSKGLKEKYIDKGYLTIDEIMAKYTPSSNGSWAFGVTQFMGEMQ